MNKISLSNRPLLLCICLILGLSVLAAAFLAGNMQDSRDVPQPDGWDMGLALNIPEDLNPDPNVLEIELEARVTEMEIIPGTTTPVWTYNGVLPGPLIRAKVGDRVI